MALPPLRNIDVWAAIKADKLDRLEAWINVRTSLPCMSPVQRGWVAALASSPRREL